MRKAPEDKRNQYQIDAEHGRGRADDVFCDMADPRSEIRDAEPDVQTHQHGKQCHLVGQQCIFSTSHISEQACKQCAGYEIQQQGRCLRKEGGDYAAFKAQSAKLK